jgi:hypothetical protein
MKPPLARVRTILQRGVFRVFFSNNLTTTSTRERAGELEGAGDAALAFQSSSPRMVDASVDGRGRDQRAGAFIKQSAARAAYTSELAASEYKRFLIRYSQN